ncbi:Transcription initiation factor TFIID subunit 13 [Penicillium tannophilum]|nr:Transcription initiation factor TFIID subunit 13 [Penicillium tannophilum]
MSAQRTGQRGSLKLRLRMPSPNPNSAPVPTSPAYDYYFSPTVTQVPIPSFSSEPLPETVRVLDEIVTDFILELCHGAAQVAHHARRQKIKVDDFRFALRRDPNKLGRVQELLRMERELKEARKAFDQNDDQVAKDAGKKGAPPANDADAGNDALPAPTGKKSKGKGKRAATRRGSDATEESVSKKRKTIG